MIKIGLLLDACGITYTAVQLSKLEKLVQNLIEQHVYNAVKQLNSAKITSDVKKLTYPTKSASIYKKTSDNTSDAKNEKVLFTEDILSIKNEPEFFEETLSEIENELGYQDDFNDTQNNENSKDCLGYGNMGCQVSKGGIQNMIEFWPKINISKEIILSYE